MRYASIAEGRTAPGLRLVLTADVPGPWGEAAKYILAFKGLSYLAVAQQGGGENAELQEWTGQAGAPVQLVHAAVLERAPRALLHLQARTHIAPSVQ